MADFKGFPAGCSAFLADLKQNNDRTWFNEHKPDYERLVRTPALSFIESMGTQLESISGHFRAIPKKTGGSLMRVYRDTRFSKDKSPYKPNIGIHFRHERGKDVHAPGFYVHIEPGNCFLGAGIWRPDQQSLTKIRDFLIDNPSAWKAIRQDKQLNASYQFGGESLQRPPRDYPKEHELIEDLKRKDFILAHNFECSAIEQDDFTEQVIDSYRLTTNLMRYLCTALDLAF